MKILKIFVECYKDYNIYFSKADSVEAYLVEVNAYWESPDGTVYIGNLPFGSLEEARTWLDENIDFLPQRICQNGEQQFQSSAVLFLIVLFFIGLIIYLGRRR